MRPRHLLALGRHWLIAWVRSLQANRLLSAIAILGLALGLAGAFLMALVARVPLGHNAFLAESDRTYLALSVMSGPGMAPDYQQLSPGGAAALIRARVPQAEAAARLAEAEVELRRGARASRERVYWGDPEIFDLLRLPVRHGDLSAALRRPDGIVMTEADALRLFGHADSVGESILVGGRPMTVRAVIADLPPHRSDLASGIIASGLAADSAIARLPADTSGEFSIAVRTYVRLRPGASAAEAERDVAAAIQGLVPPPLRSAYRIELARLDRLALHDALQPGARQRLVTGSLVAALVLFIALANYVNLAVALAARRRREIGLRKAVGASRGLVAAQFLGESVLTVLVAALLAAAASEWLLPWANPFLGAQAAFDYADEPGLVLWLLGGAILLGLAAGFYPAFVVSSARPAAVLKGEASALPGGGRVRNALVGAQFAIMIGLIAAAIVFQQQHRFATREAVRADVDRILTVAAPCPAAFVAELRKLPEIRGVSCSGAELLDGNVFAFVDWRGERVSADIVSALPSLFALYGLRPLAGSLGALAADGDDAVSRIVVNEAAVRRFGFGSAAAAIGEEIPVPPDSAGPDVRARIAAVVPDFALHSIETAIEPTIYLPRPTGASGLGLVQIRLAGERVPEALAAIDRLWRATGNSGPAERAFVNEHLERLYHDLERGAQLFAIFSGVAIFLACLGLIGLSLAAAERRSKEIAIRKALGATTGDVVALLLWQLSRPVLLANLLAWPVAWLLLQRWLGGFAYHVPLKLWVFPAAGLLALLVALASVASLAYRVARRRPIHALRHE